MLNMAMLAQTANKFKYLLNDNSTVILTGAGILGTVGTAVLTGRASFKAAKIIQEEEKAINTAVENPEADPVWLSKTEKFKLVWPHFIPPTITCAGTVTCIFLAHRITSKQIAALAVASTVSERAFQEYKDKVVEKLGPKQGTAIEEEIAQDRVTKNPPSGQVIIAGSGDVLCFETLTGRYFHSTIEDIKAAENKVNYEIIHYDSASLSTFFDELGLMPTDYSDSVGWNVHNRLEVKFTTTMSEDNRPCLVVGYLRSPIADYNKAWSMAGG